MILGENTSLIKSHNLCILGCLKDMSSAVKITSPHQKSLDIVILDLYVQYINADLVFWDILSINWNSTTHTFTSPGISINQKLWSTHVWNREKE